MLLPQDVMEQHHYPHFRDSDGSLQASDPTVTLLVPRRPASGNNPFFSMDCEMVRDVECDVECDVI
jgi:hypothetical protein